MHERLRGQQALTNQLDELRERWSLTTSSANDEHWPRMEGLREQQLEKESDRREDWAHHLRSHEAELRGNTFSTQNLDTLALAYFGMLAGDTGVSPYDRVVNLIGSDQRPVDAVMAALRRAAWRTDVPEVDETILLYAQSRRPWLAFPVLASMDLLTDEPELMHELDEVQKCRALAIYYCFSVGDQEARPCHDVWFEQDPAMVLDVLYRCAVAALRVGSEFLPGFYELDLVTGHDDLVHDARLRLLEAFPTRIPKKQLRPFDRLLGHTLAHPTKTRLKTLTDKEAGHEKPECLSTGQMDDGRCIAVGGITHAATQSLRGCKRETRPRLGRVPPQ